MGRLIVIKGSDEGKQFDLPSRIHGIGRERGNSICLHDTEVSRRHAELIPAEFGRWRLRDIGSANGTLVNTQIIQEVELEAGDHIQIGQTMLVFTSRNENPNATAAALADRVKLVAKSEHNITDSIVKTIDQDQGSMILKRPDRVGTQWLKDRLVNLGIMYETIQAVSHIMDLDQLLDRIMELIFGSIIADHGCIMLRNTDTGLFEPKAVRFRPGMNPTEKIDISRTIMDYVLQEKQGVLIADASTDDRFNTGHSIKRFNIREAICVPMKGRHEIHGVLFLDTITSPQSLLGTGRTESTTFTEDHLALAIAIAHQAALAVEETRYHQALMHSERMAAIGQTIASLSHHIKNIMQGVVFGSDMVRTGIEEKDELILRKGWGLVEKNQSKIHDLVLDMLSFSKEREPSIEMSDLNGIVRDVLELMEGRLEQIGLKVDLRLAELPKVPCDPDGIHKSLLNIVSNAIDAMEDRPEPYLGVQTLIETGGWVRIVVVDAGVGIPPDKLVEIFRPFVSTKGSRGTGLGLAVSRKIFREHGGDILVQSQVDLGSKFIMRLPLRNPTVPESYGPPGTMEAPSVSQG